MGKQDSMRWTRLRAGALRRGAFAGLVACSVGMLAGCAWVTPTPTGERVRVETPAHVAGCERLGRTHVSTRPNVGLIQRADQKIREELLILARNEAAQMGGDRVAAESAIENGRQTFGVYRCER